jgi:hypothetical protein
MSGRPGIAADCTARLALGRCSGGRPSDPDFQASGEAPTVGLVSQGPPHRNAPRPFPPPWRPLRGWSAGVVKFNSGSNTPTRWMPDRCEIQSHLHLLSKVSLPSCRVEV